MWDATTTPDGRSGPVGVTPRASAVPGGGCNTGHGIRRHGTIPGPLTCRYRECLGYGIKGEIVVGTGTTGRSPGVRGPAAAAEGAHGPQLRFAGPAAQHEHLDAAPVLRGGRRTGRLRTGRAVRGAVRGIGRGADGTAPAVALGRGGATAATGRGDGDGAGRRGGGERVGERGGGGGARCRNGRSGRRGKLDRGD